MSKSILIAEDEQVLRESLVSLLLTEGYDVVAAADGKVAYDAAVERAFDLVLTDVRCTHARDGRAVAPDKDEAACARHTRRLAHGIRHS